VDQRTDVYSLGVMLYELSCGHVPFDAENPLGILTQHMYMAPVPPNERPDSKRNVPVGLEAIILKCLSKDPDHRYRTMLELFDDLKLVAQGEVPRAVADLLARGSDELPLQRLRTAAVDAGSRRNQPSKGTWLGVLLTASLVAVLLGVIFFPNNDAFVSAPGPAPKPASATDADRSAQPAAPQRETYTVALVLSPIDAHVFDGAQDLGAMPISIQLNKGEVATLQVKRDGFVSQKVTIDGTLSKLIVELEPIAGAELDTPVPQIAPGTSAAPDAGTRVVVLRHKLRPARARGVDAGVRHTHPKHTVPADNPQTAPSPPPTPATGSASPAPTAPAAPAPATPPSPGAPAPAAPAPSANP
jgi:serine/threonine-protein kinase